MREPSELTELERAIIARSEAGETRRAICKALGVTPDDVRRAEWVVMYDVKRRQLLAECPDSIEAMTWIGELSGYAADALRRHHWYHDGPGPKRMSEVAALGRLYVSRMKGIGPKGLASIDRVLEMLGIAWSPIERTPQPKRLSAPQSSSQPQSHSDWAWSTIVRRVGEIERAVGSAVFENDPQRNSIDGVALRLSFLTGYIEGYFEKRPARKPMRDITPEPEQDDGEYETAGNLICLPGIKLADVQPNDGRPQP